MAQGSHCTILSVIMTCITLTIALQPELTKDPGFCYDQESCGPESWGGLCRTGKRQSPIDIGNIPWTHPGSGSSGRNQSYLDLDLSSDYPAPRQPYFIENNGHSIQVSLGDGVQGPRVLVREDFKGNSGDYALSQLHIHWGSTNSVGSEHRVKGQHFPLEFHLVHKLIGSDPNLDPLLVIGVFGTLCKDGPVMDPQTNLTITKLIDGINKISSDPSIPGKVQKDAPIHFDALLPSNLLESSVHYDGSLTTPPCPEIVKWIVVTQPICVPPALLNALRKIRLSNGDKNNFRPVQPYWDRKLGVVVESSGASTITLGLIVPIIWVLIQWMRVFDL